MTRNQVAAKVAENKRKHPERYCPHPKCLWATGGGYCPRHVFSLPQCVHKNFVGYCAACDEKGTAA